MLVVDKDFKENKDSVCIPLRYMLVLLIERDKDFKENKVTLLIS